MRNTTKQRRQSVWGFRASNRWRAGQLAVLVLLSGSTAALQAQTLDGLPFQPPTIGASSLPTRSLPSRGDFQPTPISGNNFNATGNSPYIQPSSQAWASPVEPVATPSRRTTLSVPSPIGENYQHRPFPHPSYLTGPYHSPLAPSLRAEVGPYVMSRLESPQQASPLLHREAFDHRRVGLDAQWGQPVFQPVTSHKESFFQKIQYSGTLIGRGGGLNFGLYESKLFATFAIPMPSRDYPLLITPGYNERYFSGPLTPDLPERVIDAYVEFMWVPKLSERWTGVIAVSPGVYSDMQDSDGDAFRITGKGLAKWDWAPGRWQLAFGVLYLDRQDISVLPAGGLIWTPNDWTRWDFLFPTPKAAWRIRGLSGEYEDWLYVAAEFGGDQWSVARAGGRESIIMRDYRLMAGVQRKRNGGQSFQLEAGFVMGRRIEFESATPDYESDPAMLVRFLIAR